MFSKIDLQMETRGHPKTLPENLEILNHANKIKHSGNSSVCQSEEDKKDGKISWSAEDTINSKLASTIICWLFSIKFFLLLGACAISMTSMESWMSLHTFVEQYYWLSFPAYGIYVILWYVIQHTRVSRKFPANSLLILSTIAIIMSFIFAASSTFTWFKPYPYIVLFSLATSATIYFAIISPFLWYCEEEK